MESLRVIAYCLNWNSRDRRPGRPISESKARKLDAQGSPYMIALGEDDRVSSLISVHWTLDFLSVWFLDEAMLRYLEYSFRRIDPERMFMTEVTLWNYPESEEMGEDLISASTVTNLHYRQDGVVSETVHDHNAKMVSTVDRSDVPVDINWEPVPKFGEWARVSRYSREE